MKATKNYMSVIFFMCLSLPFVHGGIGAGENKGQDLIQKVCQKTPSADLCVKTLASKTDSANATLKDLALISVKVASKNATQIINQLKVMIENEKFHPKVQEGLSDCKDSLLDAQYQLDNAVAALLANATKDARKWMHSAFDATAACEASLKANENVFLRNTNDAFRQLCITALMIINHLPTKL